MKKDAFYFPHDSNAKDDPKCSLLIDQLGLEGYGIFWVLVEVLRDQPNYRYPLILISSLARKYNTTAEKMKAVVNGYGLFKTENNEFFYSNSLLERMQPYEYKKEIARIAGIASAESRKQRALNDRSTDVEQTLNEGATKREEESRREESILKDINTTIVTEVTNEIIPYSEIKKLFNSICPTLPKIKTITGDRQKKVRTLWIECLDIQYFVNLFQKVHNSEFLSGRSGKFTSCGFDWVIKPSNRTKIIEGNYDNRQSSKQFDINSYIKKMESEQNGQN